MPEPVRPGNPASLIAKRSLFRKVLLDPQADRVDRALQFGEPGRRITCAVLDGGRLRSYLKSPDPTRCPDQRMGRFTPLPQGFRRFQEVHRSCRMFGKEPEHLALQRNIAHRLSLEMSD